MSKWHRRSVTATAPDYSLPHLHTRSQNQLKANNDPLIGRFSRHWHIMLSTGPTFIWKMASDYAKLKNNPNAVKVDTMPAWVWGKCKICKRECVAPPDGYDDQPLLF